MVMKKVLYILIFFFFILSVPTESFAQCNPASLSKECITKIQDGFIFVKSFNVDGQQGAKEKVEYSYVMTRDTQYFMNVCTPEEDSDGIIVTIYDSKRNPVSTNYADGKFFPALIFECKATGIYYIVYTFQDSKHYCGGSALPFKK